MAMSECEAEITGNRGIAPGVYLMTLRAPSVAGQAHPGQFVMIRVQAGLDPLLRRPFSVCGRFEDDEFGVLYKVVGRGTTLLSKKRSGECVQVLGPLGNGFQIDVASRPLWLVGGGMGTAPLLFLAQTLLERGKNGFSFLTGFSGQEDVLLPGAILPWNVATDIATDDGTIGYAGPVTELLKSRMTAVAETKGPGTICACGPSAMLQQVAALAEAAGAVCRVSLEATMACGMGVCLGCTVPGVPGERRPYLRVCTEGPVFPAEAVDWNRMPGQPKAACS